METAQSKEEELQRTRQDPAGAPPISATVADQSSGHEMQCEKCRARLHFPSDAVLVECPLCRNVFDPKEPHLAQCVSCHEWLKFPPNAQVIRCPKCDMFLTVSPSAGDSSVPQAQSQAPTTLQQLLNNLPQQAGQQPTQATAQQTPSPNAQQTQDASLMLLWQLQQQHQQQQQQQQLQQLIAAQRQKQPLPSAKQQPAAKRRKQRVKGQPKSAMNAYMIFFKRTRGELVKKRPELSFSEVGAEVGRMWRDLSDEEKKPYEEEAKQDRERYRIAMSEFMKRQREQELQQQSQQAAQPIDAQQVDMSAFANIPHELSELLHSLPGQQ